MSQRTLIIPDVHHALEHADAILAKEAKPATRVVFLGDIYDDFYDGPAQASKTARWHKEKLQRHEFLYGNHDLAYATDGLVGCSGWTSQKQDAIDEVITREDWLRTKFHIWVGEWLLTHAGLHQYYVPRGSDVDLKAYLVAEEKKAQRAILEGGSHWFWNCGRSRSGYFYVGGLVWCDFNREMTALAGGPPGLKQVCGHTPGQQVHTYKHERDDSQAICLDAKPPRFYAVYEGGLMKIREL